MVLYRHHVTVLHKYSNNKPLLMTTRTPQYLVFMSCPLKQNPVTCGLLKERRYKRTVLPPHLPSNSQVLLTKALNPQITWRATQVVVE